MSHFGNRREHDCDAICDGDHRIAELRERGHQGDVQTN